MMARNLRPPLMPNAPQFMVPTYHFFDLWAYTLLLVKFSESFNQPVHLFFPKDFIKRKPLRFSLCLTLSISSPTSMMSKVCHAMIRNLIECETKTKKEKSLVLAERSWLRTNFRHKKIRSKRENYLEMVCQMYSCQRLSLLYWLPIVSTYYLIMPRSRADIFINIMINLLYWSISLTYLCQNEGQLLHFYWFHLSVAWPLLTVTHGSLTH